MDEIKLTKANTGENARSVISVKNVSKIYKGKNAATAVSQLSFDIRPGEIFGFIGPDGAGKTSIIQMMTGVADATEGTISVAGFDPLTQSDEIKDIIGYMPQGIGLNLYDSLSVEENIRFFKDLRQIPDDVFAENSKKMLHMTRLEPFLNRQAKNLSGGMRQKLSLICTLVHLPDIIFLDEPTTGVDPRSRQEFWQIIVDLVEERHVTVVLSTSYMDEASRCHRVALMHEGKIVRQGTPTELKTLLDGKMISFTVEPQYKALTILQKYSGVQDPQLLGQRVKVRLLTSELDVREYLEKENILCGEMEEVRTSLEDVFVQLTSKEKLSASMPFVGKAVSARQSIVSCENVTIQFGSFKAVDNISCNIYSGEVFGLLGPNGAGKTTLIKSMCGLLPPSSGKIITAGYDVSEERQMVWNSIGYMSQRFSLYRDLSVRENIDLYKGLYNVSGVNDEQLLENIGLAALADRPAGKLPLGIRQRLSLICAVLHEPPVIFLDEPTSGVDPVARRDFWNIIYQLARELGKTVLVSTHYMDEAERCDRLILMDQGRLVALDSPDNLEHRATKYFGQLLIVTTPEPKKTYALVKNIFPSASMYGQDVHVRSLAPEKHIALLQEALAAAGLIDCRITISHLSMEETFMDLISNGNGEVQHV
ncbi:MAG: ATP-binding cassette domain-containing protein [Acidaminococcaceae bacterium]